MQFCGDAGKTKIAQGSLTVVAFAPMKEADVPEELETLKLL